MALILESKTLDYKIPSRLVTYQRELAEYLGNLEHPLDILNIKNKRTELSKVLLELTKTNQTSLFSDESETLENVLDNLVLLKADKKSLYQRFTKEVNGKVRELSIPQKPLDIFLKHYAKNIIEQAPCSIQAHGGENTWSPKESIRSHLPIETVLSFDLSTAWKNTHLQYVFDFYYKNILEKIKDRESAKLTAGFLATISTVYYKDKGYALPQGSPIGSKIFNRILYPIDKLIEDYCSERELTYTRWIDDFIISSKNNLPEEDLTGALNIVERYFSISEKKTKIQRESPIYLLGHKVIGTSIAIND